MSKDQVLLESRKFTVLRRDVPVGPGVVHAYDFVTHPGAAVVLPLLPDGRVLLIANYRVTVERELLELPAGTIDPPEPPEQCARRELAEETGYRAGRLEPLLSFYSSPGICTEFLHAFVATELTAGPTQREPGEEIRLVPMDLAEALHSISEHRIVDAKTIIALLYYDRFGRGGGSAT
jgi:ADP-ribose pyrophosphatase